MAVATWTSLTCEAPAAQLVLTLVTPEEAVASRYWLGPDKVALLSRQHDGRCWRGIVHRDGDARACSGEPAESATLWSV